MHATLMLLATYSNLLAVIQISATTTPPSGYVQGFKLPIHVSTHKRQGNIARTVKNLAVIDVVDHHNFAYTVQLSIGGQDFLFTLDTASSDLWVASSSCSYHECQAVKTYTKSSSLTLSKAPFTLKYVKGNVAGKLGYETVIIGQVEVQNQVFGMVTRVSDINISGIHSSGILGLAFPKASNIRRSSGKTLLENVYEVLHEKNRFFAFKLGRDAEPSYFTIGQINPDILSKTFLSYFPVYPSDAFESTYDYWKIPLNKFTFDGLSMSLSSSRVKGSRWPIATLDTGTTLILGPTRDVTDFWRLVGDTRRDDNGLWMVRCNRAITVTFTFGGIGAIDTREYSIHPRDLNWNVTAGDEWCLGGIQGNDDVISSDWLLGDTFLRNVYTTHHASTSSTPPLIGLANVTDPVAALLDFQVERGYYPIGPVNLRLQQGRSRYLIPTLVLLSAVGFLITMLTTLALKLIPRKKMADK